MDAAPVLITIGIIFSLIALAVAIAMSCIAVFSENMKYAKRKSYLKNAVVVLMNSIGYWIIIGGMWAVCSLISVLDTIIMK